METYVNCTRFEIEGGDGHFDVSYDLACNMTKQEKRMFDLNDIVRSVYEAKMDDVDFTSVAAAWDEQDDSEKELLSVTVCMDVPPDLTLMGMRQKPERMAMQDKLIAYTAECLKDSISRFRRDPDQDFADALAGLSNEGMMKR